MCFFNKVCGFFIFYFYIRLIDKDNHFILIHQLTLLPTVGNNKGSFKLILFGGTSTKEIISTKVVVNKVKAKTTFSSLHFQGISILISKFYFHHL